MTKAFQHGTLQTFCKLLNYSWMLVKLRCCVFSRLTKVVPRSLHFNKLIQMCSNI